GLLFIVRKLPRNQVLPRKLLFPALQNLLKRRSSVRIKETVIRLHCHVIRSSGKWTSNTPELRAIVSQVFVKCLGKRPTSSMGPPFFHVEEVGKELAEFFSEGNSARAAAHEPYFFRNRAQRATPVLIKPMVPTTRATFVGIPNIVGGSS